VYATQENFSTCREMQLIVFYGIFLNDNRNDSPEIRERAEENANCITLYFPHSHIVKRVLFISFSCGLIETNSTGRDMKIYVCI